MKILLAVLFILALGCGVAQSAAAPTISICRVENTFPIEFRVYGLSPDNLGWDVMTGGGGFEGDVLFVSAGEDGTLQVLYWWIDDEGQDFTGEIIADANTPACGADDPTVWHPGAAEIPIPLAADCSWIYIKNFDPQTGEWDGNWSRVEIDGEPVLLHFGESLFGGQNQSTDSSDYRVEEVACY